MAMDSRTLQRKLQNQGYSFKQLTDEVRASLAAQHLSNSNKPLTEIAEILGYSELSAFSRFFQRIYGKSPSEWRREASTSPYHD
jgi:AraC-like DNA-binding protein